MKILLKGLDIQNIQNKNTIKKIEIKENTKFLNSPNDLKLIISKQFPEFSEKLENEKEKYELFTNGKSLAQNKPIKLKNLQIFEIKFTIKGGKVKKILKILKIKKFFKKNN